MGPWKPRKTDGFLSMGLRTPPTNGFFTNKLDETDDCEIFLSNIEKYGELDADIFLQRYRKTCQTHSTQIDR